jgi:lysophospholipase L1-like esterase
MSFWSRLFAPALCVAMGLALGIGLAIARPGFIRRLSKKFGRPDGNHQWFYSQMVAFHRRIDGCVPEHAILFIGDSSIQGMCVTEVAARGINYGIGGDTTEGVLARLPEYKSLGRASAVVLAVGDNDLQRGLSEAEIIANYGKILLQLPEKISVMVCSLAPYVRGPKGEQLNPRIAKLNDAIRQVCASRPDCHFIDLNEALNDSQGFLRPEYADADGAHLNSSGYRVCIEKLRKHLREAAPDLEINTSN